MTYEVVDNFLPKEQFDAICNTIVGNGFFPWYTDMNGVASPTDKSDTYFCHYFYGGHTATSQHSEMIRPLLDLLQPKAIIRAKANCYLRSDNLIEHAQHVDFDFEHKAFIFYLNTNDGFTRMSDGTVINSVANRGLFLNGAELHNSSNCTDATVRLNISINYF